MICCLHHKRLRETESTTRHRSITFRLHFHFSFTIPSIHFRTRILQALLISRSPATYLHTSRSVESSVDRLVLIRQQKPQILEENSSSQLQEHCNFTDSPLQTSHTEAPFLGCSLSLLRSVDLKISYAKSTRSLSEW